MPTKRPSPAKKTVVEAQEAAQVFAVPGDLLKSAIVTLAELPYNKVGNLVNQLRSCKLVDGEVPADG